MRTKVFVNGHNWMARKLAANAIKFSQRDSILVEIEDIERPQRFADRMVFVN